MTLPSIAAASAARSGPVHHLNEHSPPVAANDSAHGTVRPGHTCDGSKPADCPALWNPADGTNQPPLNPAGEPHGTSAAFTRWATSSGSASNHRSTASS